MEISIGRTPQHRCSNEGSNSERFDHENDVLTVATDPQHKYPSKLS